MLIIYITACVLGNNVRDGDFHEALVWASLGKYDTEPEESLALGSINGDGAFSGMIQEACVETSVVLLLDRAVVCSVNYTVHACCRTVGAHLLRG